MGLFGKSQKTGFDLVPAKPPPMVSPPRPMAQPPANIVFAVDATASRQEAWEAAQKITDALFDAMGQVAVSLAVHGGGTVHTITPFTKDVGKLRDKMAGIACRAGTSALLPILGHVIRQEVPIPVCVYIGDVFEEDEAQGMKLAAQFGRRETRLIILHDHPRDLAAAANSASIFEKLAKQTNGAVLPFNASAVDQLRVLMEGISALAVGGIALLEDDSRPAVRLLLEHLR